MGKRAKSGETAVFKALAPAVAEDLERLNVEGDVPPSAVPLELARIKQQAPGLFVEDGQAEACPAFTLRADTPGHLRALIAAWPYLRGEDYRRVQALTRDFELYEEAHR
jgi:hypothetical protein